MPLRVYPCLYPWSGNSRSIVHQSSRSIVHQSSRSIVHQSSRGIVHEKIRQDAFDFSHERNAVNFLAFLSCLDFSTLLWKRVSSAGNVLSYLLSPMLDMLVMCNTPPLPLRTFNATR
ncbi:hypothetical protein MSLAZ_1811 [Methanosarcina lacustris Z-7289]|uniref:Uncharacterized protein n=1 Tax=Methanosarcina lacustris Z-7289 TaxID=1434111 RepID=A0A0E3S6W2_9EURY|nr:hypothetical protein MSLAZ_1811 [Methanosarcina lacustris Z-7289]